MTTGFPLHNRGILSEYADFDSRNFSQLVTAVITEVPTHNAFIKAIIKVTQYQSEILDEANYGDYYEIPVQISIKARDGNNYAVGDEILIDRLKLPAIAQADSEAGLEEDTQLNYVVTKDYFSGYPRDFDVISLEGKYNSIKIRGGSIKHIFNYDIEKLDETIYLEDATQDVVDYDEDGEATFFIYLTLTKSFLSVVASFVVSSDTLQDSYPLLLNFKLYKMIKKKTETEEGYGYAFFVERDCRTSYIYYTFS